MPVSFEALLSYYWNNYVKAVGYTAHGYCEWGYQSGYLLSTYDIGECEKYLLTIEEKLGCSDILIITNPAHYENAKMIIDFHRPDRVSDPAWNIMQRAEILRLLMAA